MINQVREADGFGCPRCWPPQAQAAWGAILLLQTEVRLVDESHCGISLRACPECGQRMLFVFTETIDWQDGEDPQQVMVMPLQPKEAARLVAAGESAEAQVHGIGVGRSSLVRDWPKDSASVLGWTTGIRVAPHD